MHNQPKFDGAWKRRAVNGDAEALDQLVDNSIEPLFRFCFYRLGRNRHLCEEVVQETLLRAIADLSNYEPKRSGNLIFPWLIGLARNEIHRAMAQEPITISLESIGARLDESVCEALSRLECSPLHNDVLQRDETREMVSITIARLPEPYRAALEAKYILRQTVHEIAAGRAISEKAVESLLSRARKAFRETFIALARELHTETTRL